MADRLAELVEVRLASAGVALVTLNLPRLRNAMTTELTSAWTAAMDEVTRDRSLRAVVVTGAGSGSAPGPTVLARHGEWRQHADWLRDTMLPFYRTWLAPLQIPVPVVAAVNGPAMERACAWRWPVTCGTPRPRRRSARRSASWGHTAGWR